MPKYKLPKEKKMDKEMEMPATTAGSHSPDHYQRSIQIPVNEEILDALAVGDMAEITLMGEITATRNDDSEHSHDRSITITVSEVMAYPEGYEEKEKKKFKKGFSKHSSHY